MKKQNIQEAFESVALTQKEKDALLENILSASGHRPAERKRTMKVKKPLLIAAIITAMAIFMGCAVAALSTKDLKLDEYQTTAPAWIDADGQRHEAREVTKTVLSLQGVRDTPEQKAALEWYQFRKSYDPDKDIYLKNKGKFQAPAEYAAYDVYSQEMVDKLDEIARKYDLQLLGREAMTYHYDWELGWNALGLPRDFVSDTEDAENLRFCRFYESGNATFGADLKVTDPAFTWENPVGIFLSYAQKGYMNTTTFVTNNAANIREWTYTRNDGQKVLVAISSDPVQPANDWTYLICDREDAFLYARFTTVWYLNDGEGPRMEMSDQDIEWLAEHIDFSIRPRKPDMDAVLPKIQKEDAEYDAMLEQDNPFRQDSFAALSKVMTAAEYALLDLNGDGQDECIFWQGGRPQLYAMKDGKTTFVGLREKEMVGLDGELKLYEGNILGTYVEVNNAYKLYTFYTVEDTSLVVQQCVVYDAANDAWGLGLGGTQIAKTITQTEAQGILNSYREIPMERKPVSQLTEE